MICDCFHITFREQLLNSGNGIFQKVMEKAMESHGILASQTCTNPDYVCLCIDLICLDFLSDFVLSHILVTKVSLLQRCPITTVNPATGEIEGGEPLATLRR